MSKTLIVIAVLLFVGAASDFVKQDPVINHVPGQPVAINGVCTIVRFRSCRQLWRVLLLAPVVPKYTAA